MSRVGLRKRCSENMQQIYRRTPIPKCDFNKIALRPGCSLVNLLDIFRTPFPKKTSGWLRIFNTQYFKTIIYFRNSLLKIRRAFAKPIYNIHNPTSLKLLTWFKLRISYLNEHQFNHNFRDWANDLCPCHLEAVSPSYFFLQSHYYITYVVDIRKILFHEWQSLGADILYQSHNEIMELLLYGRKKFKFYKNCSILKSAVRFITKSETFNGSMYSKMKHTHIYHCFFSPKYIY